MDCGLRTRCGGAWHAYWDHRGGSGIKPPWEAPPLWASRDDSRVIVTDVREGAQSLENGTSTGTCRPLAVGQSTRWALTKELRVRHQPRRRRRRPQSAQAHPGTDPSMGPGAVTPRAAEADPVPPPTAARVQPARRTAGLGFLGDVSRGRRHPRPHRRSRAS